jgi:hypothetical protein
MEAMIWMAIVLKIPVVALLWLCWYAAQAPEPAGEESTDDGNGGIGHGSGPRTPRTPRRGDHVQPGAKPPARVRALGQRSDTVPRP